MTYKEIKDRLNKCEKTLQDIKNGSYKNLSAQDTQQTVEKLTILQESLKKQLQEV